MSTPFVMDAGRDLHISVDTSTPVLNTATAASPLKQRGLGHGGTGGGYVLRMQRVIGRGATGTVVEADLLATHGGEPLAVAVKMVQVPSIGDNEALQFCDEIDVMDFLDTHLVQPGVSVALPHLLDAVLVDDRVVSETAAWAAAAPAPVRSATGEGRWGVVVMERVRSEHRDERLRGTLGAFVSALQQGNATVANFTCERQMQRPSLPLFAAIASHLLHTLAAFDEHGVSHLDLSTNNIVLATQQPRSGLRATLLHVDRDAVALRRPLIADSDAAVYPVILDFGASHCRYSEDSRGVLRAMPDILLSGPTAMLFARAPEQMFYQDSDHRSRQHVARLTAGHAADVWAVGLALVQMLLGVSLMTASRSAYARMLSEPPAPFVHAVNVYLEAERNAETPAFVTKVERVLAPGYLWTLVCLLGPPSAQHWVDVARCPLLRAIERGLTMAGAGALPSHEWLWDEVDRIVQERYAMDAVSPLLQHMLCWNPDERLRGCELWHVWCELFDNTDLADDACQTAYVYGVRKAPLLKPHALAHRRSKRSMPTSQFMRAASEPVGQRLAPSDRDRVGDRVAVVGFREGGVELKRTVPAESLRLDMLSPLLKRRFYDERMDSVMPRTPEKTQMLVKTPSRSAQTGSRRTLLFADEALTPEMRQPPLKTMVK